MNDNLRIFLGENLCKSLRCACHVDFLFADTDLQALFDIDFELQNVPPANVPSNPVQSVQSMPVQFNSLMEANNRNVMPTVSKYNCTVHFNLYSK